MVESRADRIQTLPIRRTTTLATARAPQSPVRLFAALSGATLALLAATLAARSETVITSHGISTFGDLQLPADFAHLAYVNPDAPTGGIMSQWAFGGFDSLNPYSIEGRAAALSTVGYESIMSGTLDEIGASYCLLCETLEYPEDRSWVIFNLRTDVKFADGTAMTAEDVVFTYNLFLTKGLTDFRTVFGTQVESAEALDARRVKFTFKPDIPWRDLPADVGGLPVFSKAHYEANGLDLEKSTMTAFMGTGEYVIAGTEAGRTITVKRNPDYWGKDHPLQVGRGNLDEIRIEYFSDSTAAFEAFKAGDYTFRVENSSKSWAEQYNFPLIETGQVKKVELPSGAKANGQAFIFNLRQEKFQDPRVREAIGLMFNYEWSNKTLFYGLYDRITSVWENSWLQPRGAPSPAEIAILKPIVDEGLLPASLLTDEPVMPPASGERQLDRGNLRLASELLDQAGWMVGDDGMRRNAKGEVLSVEFLNDNQQFDRVINPFVENLRALGVDAIMTKVDDAQMEARTRPPQYDFDIVTGNARSNYFSGSELQQYYGSATADVSSFNMMGLKSAGIDKLIKVVEASKTKDDLTVATMALDRALRAERFWVPQWFKATHWVAYYDMYEHPETLPPYGLGELDFWWYNAEKGDALRAAGVLR